MNRLRYYEQLKVKVQLVRDSPAKTIPKIQLESAADVYDFLKDEMLNWDREKFISIILNSRNQIIAIDEISVGSISKTIVHPREVFKSAILANAHGIVMVHNHPSEDPAPSAEDKTMTAKLKAAADILDIAFRDHVIISSGGYSSWVEGWTSHTALPDVLSF